MIIQDKQYWDVRDFAQNSHMGQRYDYLPYFAHLEMVEKQLKDFGFGGLFLRKAAWLHDVVEDTDVTVTQIEEKIGSDLADLIWRVTDESGKNRSKN